MPSQSGRIIPLAFLMVALAASSIPSAEAWTCYSTIPYECEVILFVRDTAYETTGVFFDAARTDDGNGVTVEVGVEDLGVHQSATLVVCATDERVGVSATQQCTGPMVLVLG